MSDELSKTSGKKGSFWASLPGVLTGIATLLTAITTLYLTISPNSEPKDNNHNGKSNEPISQPLPVSKHIQTVRVRTGSSTRSGFFTRKGFVITTSLGRENRSEFTVMWSNEDGEKKANASVESRVNEVLLLRISNIKMPHQHLPLGLAGSLQNGDSVERYIHENDRVKGTVKETHAQRNIFINSDNQVTLKNLVITTNISAGGDMGAPVLDKDGKLIGIVYGGSTTETILIPIEDFKPFFQDAF